MKKTVIIVDPCYHYKHKYDWQIFVEKFLFFFNFTRHSAQRCKSVSVGPLVCVYQSVTLTVFVTLLPCLCQSVSFMWFRQSFSISVSLTQSVFVSLSSLICLRQSVSVRLSLSVYLCQSLSVSGFLLLLVFPWITSPSRFLMLIIYHKGYPYSYNKFQQ